MAGNTKTILMHKDGGWMPSHPDITPSDIFKKMQELGDMLEQYGTGMGNHPEHEHMEHASSHFREVWYAVLEMKEYPNETSEVTL